MSLSDKIIVSRLDKNPIIQAGWIWYQQWLARNPNSTGVRSRVEKALRNRGLVLNKEGDLFEYSRPNRQDQPAIINAGGSIDSGGIVGIYEKIIRTITKDTSIKYWNIYLPLGITIDRLLSDLLLYHGYEDVVVSISHEGAYIISFSHTNPSRFEFEYRDPNAPPIKLKAM